MLLTFNQQDPLFSVALNKLAARASPCPVRHFFVHHYSSNGDTLAQNTATGW